MGEVLEFRPRPSTPAPAATPAPEPTTDQINSILITCLVTGLSRSAMMALQRRMQRMHDRAADNPERRQLVRAAAECVGFKLREDPS